MKNWWLCFLAVIGLGVFWLFQTSGEYYRTYSPDRQYSVYARKNNWEKVLPASPGGGGDGSGIAVLYDEVEQRVIGKARIRMIGNVTDIKWNGATAYFIGEDPPGILKPWRLPRPVHK